MRTTWRHLGTASAVAAVVASALVASAAPLPAATGPQAAAGDLDRLRVNDLQVIGTHNSYHRELSPAEAQALGPLAGIDYDEGLAYSHASIPDQLELQHVRGLELDLFADPEGGLYAEPLLRRSLGMGPLEDPAWQEPGTKVFHVADLDYETTCVALTTCLEQVRDFSRANPAHAPIMVMLETKVSSPAVTAAGGVQSPPWDAAALDRLDEEIRSVFAEDEVLTPDDVRRPGMTLEESVTQVGWPRLVQARGQVVFLFDQPSVRETYTQGRPSLEGRAVFTTSEPGLPDAAFLKLNDPRGEQTAVLQQRVREGYLVRTRSDEPLSTVRAEDTEMLEAALASGAHLISTDFPEVGMSARYGSSFVARFPRSTQDRGTVRCNPVTAPRTCTEARLER